MCAVTIEPPKAKDDTKELKPKAEKKAPGVSRREKVEAVVASGKPFVLEGKRVAPFACVCGAKGKNANVLKDKNGKEVLVGNTCLKYFDVKKNPVPAE